LGPFCALFWTAQVSAFLLWAQWLAMAVLLDMPTVVINLDETAMPRQLVGSRWNVMAMAQSSTATALVYERAGTRDTHANTTLVACICNDPQLQPHLPQFLLTRDASLSRAEQAALGGVAPPVTWLRGSAGWVSTQQMKAMLTILRRRVHECRPGCHVVVAFDAASQHLAADVLAHAARLRLLVLLVPARLTWLIQPLDTHVFAPLKRELQAAQLASRATHAQGVLQPLEWISHFQVAIRRTLVDRSWHHAMASNGLLGNTTTLREQVQRHLNGALPLPLRPPTADEVRQIVGRSRRGLHKSLLRLPLAIAAARSAGGVAPSSEPLPTPAMPRARSPDSGYVSEGTRFRHLRR